MNILSIVGVRPQFIKAAALSRELRRRHREILVHTGQHYDYQMSRVFFEQLDLPAPALNLGIGSGTHGEQTGAMLRALEAVLRAERPDWALVYGDTNSTLAGALAAAKLLIPVVHVEAGLRSFNRRMPEELNRVIADHLAALLLCPSGTAAANLATEGITRNVHVVGDLMWEVLQWTQAQLNGKGSKLLHQWGLSEKRYLLATVHRSENTDIAPKLASILAALNALEEVVIFPVHPRTRKAMAQANLHPRPQVRLLEPLGYLEMMALARSARLILTDSGGLQKEAYWLGVPCITLREETEWVETVQAGWNRLAGADPERILQAVRTWQPPPTRAPLYGEGGVAAQCVRWLEETN